MRRPQEEDVEGEWEPAQHDRRMAALFDQHYYARPDARRPPACPALDLELEIGAPQSSFSSSTVSVI